MVSLFFSTSAARNLKSGSAAVRFIQSTLVCWWNLRFSTAIALISEALAKAISCLLLLEVEEDEIVFQPQLLFLAGFTSIF